MTTLVPSFSNGSSSFLQVYKVSHKSLDGLEFRQDSITDSELAAPERVQNHGILL